MIADNSRFDWQDAERQTLERLDLRAEFEALGVRIATTAPTADGWLTCHAIDREDTSPSAGVCVAGKNGSLGRYRDFGSGQDRATSLWDLAVQCGRFTDWKEARRFYAEKAGVNLPGKSKASIEQKHVRLEDSVKFLPGRDREFAEQLAKAKPGISTEAALAAGLRAAQWPVNRPEADRLDVCVLAGYRPGQYGTPCSLLLIRKDGQLFPATDKLEARKTHLVKGSRDGIIAGGTPEQVKAASVVLKLEGPSDLFAGTPKLPAGWVAFTNTHGAGSFPSYLADIFEGKAGAVLHDADDAGKAGADKVERESATKATEFRKLALPYPVEPKHGKDVRDFINEGQGADDLLKLYAEGKPTDPSTIARKAALALDRPRINASNQDLREVTKLAWEAIELANSPPTIFRYAGLAARLESDDSGEPIIRTINEDRMRHTLARAAEWYRERKTEDEATVETVAMPPRDVVKDVLATPNMPLPKLQRIVESPVYANDGTLCLKPGYHPATRTFYVPAQGFSVPEVPARPTATDIARAKGLIADDLLGDFPFVGDAEKAHAVSLCLLAFARDLIHGATPFHLFEKPTPGTGATLLVDMLAWPALGRPLPSMTEGRDEDEWRKRLTAKFRGGTQFLNIDNLRRRLDSAAVASAITSPTWEDRVLGASEMVRIPIRCIWIGTGNNPGVSSEIARRTVRIRLDAKTDRPWLRDGFRHPNLRLWARENRPQLVWAALTLIRAWIVAGRPEGPTVLGMFEDWAKTMGGILQVAGVPGFLSNLNEFYDQSDSEGAAWRGFVADWWNHSGHAEVKVADLWAAFKGDIDLPLGDGSEQSQKIRLGKLITDMRDRIFEVDANDGLIRLQIVRGDMKQRSYQWQLVNMGEVRKTDASECVSTSEYFPQRPYAPARTRAHAPTHGTLSEILTDTHHTHPDDEPFEQDPDTIAFLNS